MRHRDQVGVLAGVLDEMWEVDWNIQETGNRIFAGGEAAIASIRFSGTYEPETLRRIEGHDDVFATSANVV